MAKLSGATQQSLATLLDSEATHSVIESLYLRFDVEPQKSDFAINKLKKATHLVTTLGNRPDGTTSLLSLIEYVGSDSSRMSPAFRRGNAASEDLSRNLDRDLRVTTGEGSTGQPAAKKPARQFQRPPSGAPIPSPSTPKTKRYVFVVRGRDLAAYDALAALLMSLDLRIVTWEDAVRGVEGGTPHTLDIVRAGIDIADAVVVLMTPDDLGYVKEEFHNSGNDDPREAKPYGQARQNVIFEAGWAMALNQGGVVLVRVGNVRGLSDVDGLNYVNLTGDLSSRRTLINRLRNSGLELDDSADAWRTAGSFPTQF